MLFCGSEVQLLPVILPSLQRKDLQILYVVASGEHTIAVFEPHEVECLTPMDQRFVNKSIYVECHYLPFCFGFSKIQQV